MWVFQILSFLIPFSIKAGMHMCWGLSLTTFQALGCTHKNVWFRSLGQLTTQREKSPDLGVGCRHFCFLVRHFQSSPVHAKNFFNGSRNYIPKLANEIGKIPLQ